MKRIIIALFTIAITASSCVTSGAVAMSSNDIRVQTRFLTDRMAHELSMNTMQYNDAYEINYDFVYAASSIMPNVLHGEAWAMDRYYRLLDIRNDDLRWILSSRQYQRFLGVDYFYRPIYVVNNNWQFRVYLRYTNHHHFYFKQPRHFTTYNGAHYRTHHNNVSFYRGRYHHDVYGGSYSVRHDKVYTTHRRSDFGSINIRPNTERPGTASNSNRRNTGTSAPSRGESINKTTRPSTSDNRKETSGRPSNGFTIERNDPASRKETVNSSSPERTTRPAVTESRKESSESRSSARPASNRKSNESTVSNSSRSSSSRSSSSRSTVNSGSNESSRSSATSRSSSGSSARSSRR